MNRPSLQAWTVFKGRREKQARERSVPLDQETLLFAVSTKEVSADFRYHCFKVFLFLKWLFTVNISTEAVNPDKSTWKNCIIFDNYDIIWAVTIQVCWNVTPCRLV
jgi:hypothetical protein